MANLGHIGAVAAITALLSVGGGLFGVAQVDVPAPESVSIRTVGAPSVVSDDPHDLLSPDDESRLLRDSANLAAPDTVRVLHWMVFNQSHENFNDTIEEFMRDNYPEQIGTDKFADGVLIVAAGTEQRKVATFAGEDVAEQLKLRTGERLEEVNEEIKPGMRDGNIPAAMFAGARAAMDTAAVENYILEEAQDNRTGAGIAGGLVAGGVGFGDSAAAVMATNRRRKAIEQGREDYELVTTEYAELGQRLGEIDIRANSLTSAFADNEMRKQWAEVRDRFLRMHDSVSGAGGIGGIDINDDKQVWQNRVKLGDAAETVRHTSNAEDNINRLFKIENGDAAARRSDLTSILDDINEARLRVKDKGLKAELEVLKSRVEELDRNPDDPEFLDKFVRVLGEYRVILDAVKTKQFSDVKERNPLVQPAIYEPNYFYSNYVPYMALNSWHTSNVEAAQAAQGSSSGTNTSFSSGFSASGGSSSY
ncbi:DUF5129 domain-containing protein [Corynebacterium lipophiloflavum]|uniref:DUF5129 domain-containing protein n=1 Tax=Corynebacterium lipophiloflavum (strain ATCC 700352 / DSM 44291 / CCUG 37336 / JCM 10383 / DMMZ 1944) TaxID=525263 RepID=C0XTE6_CORLD|nr:DUF5129 domain-containing protein [Corynebacterium lipophiloflavum]EEI16443.1 hypothetical protein HMPREF0298_1716 [Corynebacterium lipophiloflavum DSM 44291]